MTSFSLAILFVLRTGVSWRDLPSCFGNWHTVYTRFKQSAVPTAAKKKNKMDLLWIDSTTVSLHRLRVWGIKKTKPSTGLGRKG